MARRLGRLGRLGRLEGRTVTMALIVEVSMDAVIQKMRADWAVVATERKALGDWSETDSLEIANAIRLAIDENDRDAIACWSRWLADLSAWVTAWNLICRGSEAEMKRKAKEAREKQR